MSHFRSHISTLVLAAWIGAAAAAATATAAPAAAATAAAAAAAGDGYAGLPAVREALAVHLGGGDRLRVEAAPALIPEEARRRIAAATGSPFADDTLRIYVCTIGDSLAGYGIMDNVLGMSRDITYLVALSPGRTVAGIEVLVYRESHGGEIASDAFGDQFLGKAAGDRLRPGRDVRTISGATISSRSVTNGVAKLLAAFELVGGAR